MQLAPVRRSSNQVTKGDCNLLCGDEVAIAFDDGDPEAMLLLCRYGFEGS